MIINRFIAEFLGTATLLVAVVGSSFMADQLSQDEALALLINALVTAAVLTIIIKSFINKSGAHFKPAVTMARVFTSAPAGISPSSITAFMLVQIGVAIILGKLIKEKK